MYSWWDDDMSGETDTLASNDQTRELYKDFNAAFAAKWQKDSGETVK
ncbi:hypothetical protein AB9E07_35330, partial [Rhizobium leguminosarum]